MTWSDWFLPSGAQTSAEAEANYARLQSKLDRSIEARKKAGTLTTSQEDFYRANGGPLASQNAAAIEGAKEGLVEGWNNVLNAPGKAVGAVGDSLSQSVWGILKSIPWWLYLVALVAAFFYLGGGIILRRSLSKL